MKFLTVIFSLCFVFELKCEDTLVFVHVIFRHGERTPDTSSLYQASPYQNESYYKPYGFSQLTNVTICILVSRFGPIISAAPSGGRANAQLPQPAIDFHLLLLNGPTITSVPTKREGKLTAYNLGKDLRKRYSDFLDEEYNIKLIDARSSAYNRTKASLEAMLAGLFPPSKDLIWLEGLNWQPIPYNYVEPELDKELFCHGCPKWFEDFRNYINSNDGQQLLSPYKDTFEIISKNTGEDYDLIKTYPLYYGIDYLNKEGYTLPDWTTLVFPYPMKDILIVYYDIMLGTKYLRQLATGYLLKKILSDVHEKIDGQIPDKKMSIWSGHETNIAPLLVTLNVYDRKEVPSCGSNILMELHFIDQQYGFKIYYSNEKSAHELLRIPGCGDFCPLDQFEALMKENIPESDNMCEEASSAMRSTGITWIIALFYLIPTFNIL